MAKRYWRITGYKKTIEIFDVKIPVSYLNESQLEQLLKCLAAKAALSFHEIIGAYVKRKTRLAHGLLDVVWGTGSNPGCFCGNDPSFVADIVDEEGNRIK